MAMVSTHQQTSFFRMAAAGIVFTLLCGAAAAEDFHLEKDYSNAWCKAQGGESNAVLQDNTRPDCLLDDVAVEFDFGSGMKPYECTGQALHYAAMTNKKSLCILIKKKEYSEKSFAAAVSKVRVSVQCMNNKGIIIHCP